jgi:HEAT repeat protein
MAKLHPEKAIPLLLASLESEDAIIRENAIDELDDLDFKGAVPYLSKLINDPDINVRQAAQTALDNLQDTD